MPEAPALLADQALESRLRSNLRAFDRLALPPSSHRAAAVALVITAGPEQQACFVLTKRAAKLRAHAGQWALPGGGIDDGEDAAGAALREVFEEVGLELSREAVLGQLDDYSTRSGYVITPVVIWYGRRAQYAPNPIEVAAVYDVPLHELGHPQVPRLQQIAQSDKPVIQVPLPHVKATVHAPTAAIVYQLWEVAVQGRATRVAHYEQPVFAWR
jgi:8-oxo-dGTP pyrophosphatase MutT (NUDIX family)